MTTAEQIKAIRDALGLTLQGLATALDVKLQRVKHLSSGKVQKLNPDENKALVALGVNPEWLTTGVGPVISKYVVQVAPLRSYGSREEIPAYDSRVEEEEALLSYFRALERGERSALIKICHSMARGKSGDKT